MIKQQTQNKKNINYDSTLKVLFGGTFDPIHYGHLRPIEILAQQFNLNKITLIPNNISPNRSKPKANTEQRLKMIKLAIQDNPLFNIDTREIYTNTPSYTIKTLLSFKNEIDKNKSLILIIGQDTLLSINTWYKWQQILQLCNIIVCARHNFKTYFSNPLMQKWLNNHQTYNYEILKQKAYGNIFFANTPLLNISATKIRNGEYDKNYLQYILHPKVIHYIHKYNLY